MVPIVKIKTDHIWRIAASELPNAGGALIGLLCAMSGLPTSTWSECGLRPQNVSPEAPGDEAHGSDIFGMRSELARTFFTSQAWCGSHDRWP